MKRIHFYSDSSEWGGHEVLSAWFASILADSNQYEVTFFYYHTQFPKHLSHKIKQIELPFHTRLPFPIIREMLSFRWKRLIPLFRKESPDTFVVCQGNIERCLAAIYAAEYLKIKVISYIPMGYSQAECKAPFAKFRDYLARSIYSKVHSFIVCTSAQVDLLRRFVSNNTSIDSLEIPYQGELFQPKTKFPSKFINVAVVGRVYFKQKGQDILPSVAQIAEESVRFHIYGDGPDLPTLKKSFIKNQLTDSIVYHGWVSSEKLKADLSSQIDLVFIPSAFEGGPTVLFEALSLGIPTLTASESYTSSYRFPSWMCYQPNSAQDAAEKLLSFPKNFDVQEFNDCRIHILSNRSPDKVKEVALKLFSHLTEP